MVDQNFSMSRSASQVSVSSDDVIAQGEEEEPKVSLSSGSMSMFFWFVFSTPGENPGLMFSLLFYLYQPKEKATCRESPQIGPQIPKPQRQFPRRLRKRPLQSVSLLSLFDFIHLV